MTDINGIPIKARNFNGSVYDPINIDEQLKANISRNRFLFDKDTTIGGWVSASVYKHLEGKWYTLADHWPNLLTTDGRDFFIQQCYTNNTAGTRGCGFLALTADATAPAAGDTTLASEINNTNGMGRADATTKAHTDNTNAATIEHEWTASGTVNSIQKCAMFNASSSGIMTHEGTFTSASVISGDKLKVTYGVTMG